MKQGFSVYLDALRFLAAVVVLLSHLAYARFTGGDLQVFRDWDIGSDAVVIFFVLSGLLIARASERDGNLGRFAFNRATRLWSVLIPVLVLTLLLDKAGSSMAPAAYDGWWYVELPAWEYLLRGFSFSNQWFGDPVRLGTNGPLWSLSYEAAYYAMFGAFVFLTGAARWLCLLLFALISGPAILLMLPIWLIGVLLWKRLRREEMAISNGAAVLCMLVLPVAYIVGQDMDRPGFVEEITRSIALLLRPWGGIGFSETFLWDTFLALCLALHLYGAARLLKSVPVVVAGPVRWLAGASFTIYVLHYPLLQFLNAVLPQTFGRDAILFGLTLAACFVTAQFTERQLGGLRSALSARSMRTS